MKKVILASGNKGKLSELQSYLTRLNIELVPQPKTAEYDVEETGTTFVENAIIKARHAAKLSGLPAIADDSGLMIDALDFQPGVYTARYAGVGCSSQDNIDLILKNLKSYPDLEKRKATFICVLVYMESAIDPLPVVSLGTWRGAIYPKMMGEGGFGYDPIFWDFKHQMTAAQMSKELKSELSHRGEACRKLLDKLSARYKSLMAQSQ
ncbi:MAG: RdgB/HAM1 family non-canonical purine NTP pyrophosphatase [Xanthomonadales bacterium]|nr:RdgB/HAM1 family non-canonical purine NTP pyrophosphatase [Xanthomonadales bacterium]MCB1594030.1 RdgB/HAM1 family non-canonical purine NTP pyrophosphatase [Xanthomonadales bacterium]